MKNTLLGLLFSGALCIIFTSGVDKTRSSGAPVGSTGAPEELTCGKSGCHIGDHGLDNINTGQGILSISSTRDLTNYIPGETYDITVALEELGVERFGFSLTVLDENNKKTGTLLVTDEQRTQIFDGGLQFKNKEYITYRMLGTNPYETNKGLWTFKWKAPNQDVGNITFYVAGVSADNDATHYGDLVYTQTLRAKANPSYTNYLNNQSTVCTIFPNPIKNTMSIRFDEIVDVNTHFCIHNMEGRRICVLPCQEISMDGRTFSFSIKDLNPGIYFLKMENKSFTRTTKIVVTD